MLGACDCDAATHVEGERPYERCVAHEREHAAFGRLQERALSLDAVAEIEVYRVSDASVSWLEEAGPAPLQIVLGGFARDDASTERLLPLIAARGPALLLPGAEDDARLFERADAHDQLEVLRGISTLRIGALRFLVVAGAASPELTRGENACAIDDEVIALTRDGLESLGEGPVYLLSWAAPRREGLDPLDRGLLAQHVGSPALASLGEFAGGVHAWPYESAMTTSGGDALWAVVGALGSLQVDSYGGRRLGQVLRLQVEGDSLVAAPAAPNEH